MDRRFKKDMESLSLKNTSFLAENLWVFFRHVGTNFLPFFYGLKHTWDFNDLHGLMKSLFDSNSKEFLHEKIFKEICRFDPFPAVKIHKFLRIRVPHTRKPPSIKKSTDLENF